MVTIQNPRTADIPWSRMATARFQEAMSLADPALSDDAGLKIGVTMNPEHADDGSPDPVTISRNCWRWWMPVSLCRTFLSGPPCAPR